MTCDKKNTTDAMLTSLLPILGNGDENRFRDVLQLLLNASMLVERQQHLRALPHERTEDRNGHANGLKRRCVRRGGSGFGEQGQHVSIPSGRGSTKSQSHSRVRFCRERRVSGCPVSVCST